MTYLITGASGLLGRNLVQSLINKEKNVIACFSTHPVEFDTPLCKAVALPLENLQKVSDAVISYHPTTIIHCAAVTNVDLCEKNYQLAQLLHVDATQCLAALSQKIGCKFVYISTDHLFGGTQSFYKESDLPRPLNVYAKTKFEGECTALDENPETLVIRTNFFGKGTPWRQSLTDWIWGRLMKGMLVPAFTDSYFTPIAIPVFERMMAHLLKKDAIGIYNVCGSERLSKYDFARRFAQFFGFSESNIIPSSIHDMDFVAERPLDMSLETKKIQNFLGLPMPLLDESFLSIQGLYPK